MTAHALLRLYPLLPAKAVLPAEIPHQLTAPLVLQIRALVESATVIESPALLLKKHWDRLPSATKDSAVLPATTAGATLDQGTIVVSPDAAGLLLITNLQGPTRFRQDSSGRLLILVLSVLLFPVVVSAVKATHVTCPPPSIAPGAAGLQSASYLVTVVNANRAGLACVYLPVGSNGNFATTGGLICRYWADTGEWYYESNTAGQPSSPIYCPANIPISPTT
ncbi:hypothetical protein P389DRAFT_195753 [Cystobasidium minutum MCA 4210]|uniref:uncharacterized protein n=1 Tax=Cystobasidium minutum MCA 4210 TaxID=1397322 RepID=UPI0034CDA2BC|eukprot:jgi/Rhomi1/195753/gm1.3967_g